ncbi:MAG: class I SAM-dependent methyltransferase [Acetobacteraceae bacterium]|nr:class I SAM-dependent methyltransferase [Acetobacteraceae bacterium]
MRHRDLKAPDVFAMADLPPSPPADCSLCQNRASARRLLCKDGYDIYLCGNCFYLFVHPFPSTDFLLHYYNDRYRNASAQHYSKARQRRGRARMKALRFFPYIRGKSVLDLGCGGGFMCEAFRWLGAGGGRHGGAVVGVDVSAGAIAYARQHFPKCTFYCKGLTEFSRRGMKFDFIFSAELLEHLPGPESFMDTVAAVSKPGTFVYLSAPDFGHEAVPSDLQAWPDLCPPEHLQWFTAENLEALFARYRFRLYRRWHSKTPAHLVMFQKL